MAKIAHKTTKQQLHNVQIGDFFGVYSTYRVFALKSTKPALNFADNLSKTLNVAFTALPDFHYEADNLSACFTVFYAEFKQKESIHCLLLENKTETNQQELFSLKLEKNSRLLNYSLFAEPLYLFNANKKTGYRCFKSKCKDVDYLLFIFAKKDIDSELFSQFLKKITPFKAEEVPYLLKQKQLLVEGKRISLLVDFLGRYEVIANELTKRKKLDILGPVKQIPKQNLESSITISLSSDPLTDNMQLPEEYLALLTED